MLNECCKFSVCVFSLFAQRGFSVRRSWRAFREEILGKPMETLKLIVPSGLYCLQNNLLFIALTNLDAATYQVSTVKCFWETRILKVHLPFFVNFLGYFFSYFLNIFVKEQFHKSFHRTSWESWQKSPYPLFCKHSIWNKFNCT